MLPLQPVDKSGVMEAFVVSGGVAGKPKKKKVLEQVRDLLRLKLKHYSLRTESTVRACYSFAIPIPNE